MSWINRNGVAFCLAVLLFLFTSCKGKELTRYDEEKFLFGTHIKMIVFAEDKKAAQSAMESAFNEIERIDKKYNSKDAGSDIYKLNSLPEGKKNIELDEEGRYLFTKVNEVFQLTEKKYDITIYPLMEIWGFLEDREEKVPGESEIKEAQKLIGYENVVLSENSLTINAPVKEIDTGSFLKGYAVEKAAHILKENGVEYGFVSSLSSIATIGGKPDGTPWKVGIQNPQFPEELLGVVELKDESMGVSGDYQTFVEIDGKRYHHILDRETGYPVRDKKMVVVMGQSALIGDLLSTGFFLMKNKNILEYSQRKGLKTLLVNEDMSQEKSDNFKFSNK
ncbi:MAG: FAD:protein FMN transferase [Fusobacteriaceae bacterium]